MFLQIAHMEDMCFSSPLHPFIKARLWDGFCKHALPLHVLHSVNTSLSHSAHICLFALCSRSSLSLYPTLSFCRPTFNWTAGRTTSVSLTSSWMFMGERKSPFYFFSGFSQVQPSTDANLLRPVFLI